MEGWVIDGEVPAANGAADMARIPEDRKRRIAYTIVDPGFVPWNYQEAAAPPMPTYDHDDVGVIITDGPAFRPEQIAVLSAMPSDQTRTDLDCEFTTSVHDRSGVNEFARRSFNVCLEPYGAPRRVGDDETLYFPILDPMCAQATADASQRQIREG